MGGDERSLGRKGTAGTGAAQDIDALPGPAPRPVVPGRRMSDPTPAADPPDAAPHDWRPARFMVIAAHPDDAEFGPSGTAAAWIDAGSTGWLVCCTSGDQGGEDPDADPLELAALRETEQRAACAVIGYEGVTFLHQPDGALANDLALREMLVREIRTFQPDAVLATDPEALFHRDGGHQPHRPSRGRARGGRRGLSRRPATRWRSRRWRAAAWRPTGPPAVPVLVQPARRLGRHLGDARAQDRGAGRARQPDPRARAARRSGSGRGPPRRARRSGSPPPRRCG